MNSFKDLFFSWYYTFYLTSFQGSSHQVFHSHTFSYQDSISVQDILTPPISKCQLADHPHWSLLWFESLHYLGLLFYCRIFIAPKFNNNFLHPVPHIRIPTSGISAIHRVSYVMSGKLPMCIFYWYPEKDRYIRAYAWNLKLMLNKDSIRHCFRAYGQGLTLSINS